MDKPFYGINLPEATLKFCPDWIPKELGLNWLNLLKSECEWRQDKIILFGKPFLQPRLVAWYGEPEAVIRYSGIEMRPLPWFAQLQSIREMVEQACQTQFNGVLINWYRTGTDSMGWHADDEKELGDEPTIASLSLGATRKFQLKHKTDKSQKAELQLTHGSLLIMAGKTQANYKHQIPKTTKPIEERINLTFRKIIA